MGHVLAWMARRPSLAHIRFVAPVTAPPPTGPVARVYGQIEADFGMLAPPLALHAPAPAVLTASWAMLRETLLVPSGLVSRAAKEAVAAAVSAANACPYCVEIHGAALSGLLGGPDSAALAADRIAEIADPALRALATWARNDKASGDEVPFDPAQAPELVGVAVTFHYLNRMVNVFLQDSPLPPAPAPVRRLLRRGAAQVMGRLARSGAAAGASVEQLPPVALPVDLSWAVGQSHVARAMAAAASIIDDGGRRRLSDDTRMLVTAQLEAGSQMPGIGQIGTWLDEQASDLPTEQRPAARLALAVAVASHQVTGSLVQAYRDQGNDDTALIELTAWASFTASRHIGRAMYSGPVATGS